MCVTSTVPLGAVTCVGLGRLRANRHGRSGDAGPAATPDGGRWWPVVAPWEQRPPGPEKPAGAIVILHGGAWSALPDFDLQAPGQRRSVMDALVAEGYATYALDRRGYGAITAPEAVGASMPDGLLVALVAIP